MYLSSCGQHVYCHINIETLIFVLPLMWHLFDLSDFFFCNIIADHYESTAWSFINLKKQKKQNTEPIVFVIMACSFTKDLWFQIPMYSHTWHGKVGHILALLCRKWITKRWTVECMAFGSGWQIHYCFAHSSKQSKCCFGEWAVTVPAPRQHHTININKREKVRCPQGYWILARYMN